MTSPPATTPPVVGGTAALAVFGWLPSGLDRERGFFPLALFIASPSGARVFVAGVDQDLIQAGVGMRRECVTVIMKSRCGNEQPQINGD